MLSRLSYIALIIILTIILLYLNFYLGYTWNLAKPLWWQTPTFTITLMSNMLLPGIMGMHLIGTWSKRK